MRKIFFVISFLIFINCVDAQIKTEVDLLSIWSPKNIYQGKLFESSGLYKGMLYFPQRESDKYTIHFTTLDGVEKEKVYLKIGKGPGEVQMNFGITIVNDKIYFYDRTVKKLSIFTIKGEYLDEYLLNDDIGQPSSFVVSGNHIIFHSMYKNLLTKIDISTGNSVQKLEYPNPNYFPKHKDPFMAGTLAIDPTDNSLYLGYYNTPFRIEKYDQQFRIKHTYKSKNSKKSDKTTWVVDGSYIINEGLRTISTLVIDNNYIYACSGGGNTFQKGKEHLWAPIKDNLILSVFDKTSGKHLREITVKNIKTIRGSSGVIAVTNEKIILALYDNGDSIKSLLPDVQPLRTGYYIAFAIIENPMYKK